jgi:homeobox-leucine zipper protein
MNKLLMEENERLQKQVSQLVHENAQVRQQLKNVSFCYGDVGVPLPPPSYKHALAQVLFIHISFA